MCSLSSKSSDAFLWRLKTNLQSVTRRKNKLNNMAEGRNSRSLRSRSLEVIGPRKNKHARGRHARLGNSRVIAREFPLPFPFPPSTHALAKKLETFTLFLPDTKQIARGNGVWGNRSQTTPPPRDILLIPTFSARTICTLPRLHWPKWNSVINLVNVPIQKLAWSSYIISSITVSLSLRLPSKPVNSCLFLRLQVL